MNETIVTHRNFVVVLLKWWSNYNSQNEGHISIGFLGPKRIHLIQNQKKIGWYIVIFLPMKLHILSRCIDSIA